MESNTSTAKEHIYQYEFEWQPVYGKQRHIHVLKVPRREVSSGSRWIHTFAQLVGVELYLASFIFSRPVSGRDMNDEYHSSQTSMMEHYQRDAKQVMEERTKQEEEWKVQSVWKKSLTH